jgi:uncharacterized protein
MNRFNLKQLDEPLVSGLEPTAASSQPNPDYVGLVKFLVEPFLESTEVLKVDCEIAPRPRRVLIRLAFEGEDKGRVFGRGGRNIQAIRSVLQAVAQTVGYSAHVDVYGSQTGGRDGSSEDRAPTPARPRPLPRPRSE